MSDISDADIEFFKAFGFVVLRNLLTTREVNQLREEVQRNYPVFTEPPDPDDTRPMTNSWQRFGEIERGQSQGESP